MPKIDDETLDEREFDRLEGNIYAAMGLPDAEEYDVKSELALAIARVVEDRGLTKTAAAAQAGIATSDMSNITRGKLQEISQTRLEEILTALGQDVVIFHAPTRQGSGRGVRVVRGGAALPEGVMPVAAAGKSH